MAWRTSYHLMRTVKTLLIKPSTGLALLVTVATGLAAQNVREIGDEQFSHIKSAFQQHLDQALQKSGLPGATAAFILPDGRQASFASGVRDLKTRVPMQPTDPMFAASVGKTFVS